MRGVASVDESIFIVLCFDECLERHKGFKLFSSAGCGGLRRE